MGTMGTFVRSTMGALMGTSDRDTHGATHQWMGTSVGTPMGSNRRDNYVDSGGDIDGDQEWGNGDADGDHRWN